MNRYSSAASAAALLMVLAGCSSSSKSSSATTPVSSSAAATTTAGPPTTSGAATTAKGIIISNFTYSGTLTVKAGSAITVTNKDSAAHTLTDKKTKKFDTGNIPGNGGTAKFTAPTKPGSYSFGCTYHPNMAGTLIVTA